jgi:hypothetical protein
LQLSVVQELASSQTTGVPKHAPPEHVSPVVQAFRSEQGSALSLWTHPATGSQLSVVQGLLSLQLAAVPGRHVPNAQASPVVQAFPSSQAMVLLLKTQPVAGSQLSVVQRLASSQTRGTPEHAPPEHVSLVVHASRSLHALWLFVKTHPVAGSQVSVVQTLLSPQTRGAPG